MSDVMEMLQYDESEGAGENVSIASAQNRSGALEQGRYYIYATVDCWWKRGGSTVEATAETTAGTDKSSHFLPAGTFWFFTIARRQVYDGNRATGLEKNYVSVIRSSTDGVLYIRRAAR